MRVRIRWPYRKLCFDPSLLSRCFVNKQTFAIRCGLSLPKLEAAAECVTRGDGYHEVFIPKRQGGWRRTFRPTPSVDVALTAIRDGLSSLYTAPKYVHGYVRGRDTTTNARPHCGKKVVLRIDLEDFFGTINRMQIEETLRGLEFSEDLVSLIASMACIGDELPAGFPSSPVLSNMVFATTDEALAAFAESCGLSFTRYADDMAFSAETLGDAELEVIEAILNSNGWRLNEKKTRFMRSGKAQYVTGLYVGLADGPRIPRRLKRALRLHLYFLRKHGYDDCHSHVPWTPGHRKVWGLIHYIKRLEPSLANELAEAATGIDFQLPERLGVEREWDELLEDLGVPEWL